MTRVLPDGVMYQKAMSACERDGQGQLALVKETLFLQSARSKSSRVEQMCTKPGGYKPLIVSFRPPVGNGGGLSPSGFGQNSKISLEGSVHNPPFRHYQNELNKRDEKNKE